MNGPCLRDLATHLGVPLTELGPELRARFEAVLEAAGSDRPLAHIHGSSVHADLDALAEFVATVRLDLPVPFLPATRIDDAAEHDGSIPVGGP